MAQKKCNCSFCETEMKEVCGEENFCSRNFIEFAKCEKCGIMYEKFLGKCPQCSQTSEDKK